MLEHGFGENGILAIAALAVRGSGAVSFDPWITGANPKHIITCNVYYVKSGVTPRRQPFALAEYTNLRLCWYKTRFCEDREKNGNIRSYNGHPHVRGNPRSNHSLSYPIAISDTCVKTIGYDAD